MVRTQAHLHGQLLLYTSTQRHLQLWCLLQAYDGHQQDPDTAAALQMLFLLELLLLL
jgi:hypothetical protein